MAIDLTTEYMGLKLKNPLVASASPLSEDIDNFKRLEDAGASAVVHYSLFEEQITREIYESYHYSQVGTDSFAESLSYFPTPSEFVLGPEEYVTHIEKAKKAVDIPIFGSLNCHSTGDWIKYAKYIEDAGADGLELNIYFLAADANESGPSLELRYLEILKSVKQQISIPVALKLSPFFTSFAHMAKQFEQSGADALVLFNRFYQPDIDLENLRVQPNLMLSSSYEMRLPLRWIGILRDHLKISLASTTGVHSAEDVIKMIMVGADVTMLCSVLLKNGIEYIQALQNDVTRWLEEHEYESIRQMKGSMSQKSYEDPSAFERANYIKILKSYH